MYSSPMRAAALAVLGLAALAPSAAFAQTQDLFITNYSGGTVSRFAGTGPGTIAATSTTVAGGLNSPVALTFDARGDLLVSNTGANSIVEYAAGATPDTLGAATTLTAPNPEGLALDAGGDLFAANYGGNSILEFAAGAVPGTFGAGTPLSVGVTSPDGLAFDARGDLFVADTFGQGVYGNITELPAGATPGTFGQATTLDFRFKVDVYNPRGLAVDSRGDLFAANEGSNTITEFTAGAVPGTFGTVTSLSDPSLNDPQGLAFDAYGDLFVANLFSGIKGSPGPGTITEFAAGTTPGTFGAGVVVASGLDGPSGLAFGPLSAPAVPEASTTVSLGLLLALGLGGLAAARKRRGKA